MENKQNAILSGVILHRPPSWGGVFWDFENLGGVLRSWKRGKLAKNGAKRDFFWKIEVLYWFFGFLYSKINVYGPKIAISPTKAGPV